MILGERCCLCFFCNDVVTLSVDVGEEISSSMLPRFHLVCQFETNLGLDRIISSGLK